MDVIEGKSLAEIKEEVAENAKQAILGLVEGESITIERPVKEKREDPEFKISVTRPIEVTLTPAAE